ncbi:MarR family winged helix-turn-helix transcriptional regulator [Piscinibacter sp.]|uniref:MarR family winged helix-turn-helix transcriptional regulator n=1 Tax=Piscinibacter sp. TaxID=1903157 RepID=UPI0039E6ED96
MTSKSIKPSANDDAPVDLDLEDSLPYLIARAGMRMGLAFTGELKQFGLTLTEWRACVALLHQPGQRLLELSAHTSADVSTLSRNVDSLIRRGLLSRDRSSQDARAVALSLTPQGLDVTRRIVPLAQLYERVATAGISPAQLQTLRDQLRLIYQNLALLEQRG